ncbi:MAG: Crp/Fnr family transcriptional regulator [Clostridia bacterium]|nr:Crp/Fnr family transcriptional regulator [Clostridia bacterium]MBR6754576.1 Crp/Fnr family transcriptional regulator [Clostridia bacterium]
MYKNIIPSNMLFKDLNENEIEKALNLFSSVKRKYSKGENIASAGTRLEKFGLVLSGTVQVSFIDIDGNSVIMASVTKGDTFGESLCWLNISEIPVTVTAFTDVEVLLLSPQSLSSSTDALALELKNRFVSMLATKALAMNDRIQILSKPTVRQKIITFLSQYSNRSQSKTFSVPFDRETLALYLGVNRSALSRELSAMQKEGIIEFYKNTFKIL